MKKKYIIDDDFSGSRLDRWFKKIVCKVPQSLIEKSLRKGKIKINGKKNKSSYQLVKNDVVEIYNLNFKDKRINTTKEKYLPNKVEISSLSNLFLENNENFAIINKPAGISVQSGTKSRRNILDILRNTKEFNDCYPYAVHRIDKETTGVLIVAKNRKYAQLFTTLFRIRKIHKTYLGIIIGNFDKDRETLIDDIFYYEGEKKIKTRAITHFKVIDSNNNYSLLKLNPETGRKHQIRKQLLIHGHPILGDSKYRISKNNKVKKNSLMLHAYNIKFIINEIKYSFSAEPPLNFLSTLKQKYLKIS